MMSTPTSPLSPALMQHIFEQYRLAWHGPRGSRLAEKLFQLDLLRVWVTPDPDLLCTVAAREPQFMEWCNQRARTRHHPPIVERDWLPLLG